MSVLALPAAVAVVPAGQSFEGTPARVWNGDGPVWCAERQHVRLTGIAAREMDGTCRANQPCPDADAVVPCYALVLQIGQPIGKSPAGHILVRGPTMRCRSDGGASGNRTAAWCALPVEGDILCAMVNSGWALQWGVYWRRHRC